MENYVNSLLVKKITSYSIQPCPVFIIILDLKIFNHTASINLQTTTSQPIV
jgi:hypothetical protein